MEESTPQQTQDLEYQEPTEDQGGIRRRLRDRELLKKRKAEAEEKETNQWVFGDESPRKRARAEKRGRRGRPRKAETVAEIPLAQDEPEAPAVVLVPSEALTMSGTDTQAADLPAQASVFPDLLVQVGPTPAFGSPAVDAPSIPIRPDPVLDPLTLPLATTPTLAPPSDVPPSFIVDTDPVAQVLVDPTPAFVPPSVVAPSIALTPQPQEAAQAVAEDSAVTQADAAPPTAAPSQEESISTAPQKMELANPVTIEDLGPDEAEDFPQTQDFDKDLMSLNNMAEQNQKFFTQPSALPQQQEYLPGN